MVQFMLGTFFGGLITVIVMAIVSINRSDYERNIQDIDKETKENHAENE